MYRKDIRYGRLIDGVPHIGLHIYGLVVWFELKNIAEVNWDGFDEYKKALGL